MADTSELTLYVFGKKRGDAANDEKSKVDITEAQYPDLMATLRAYFEKNPDVERIVAKVKGK
jgi:hypothetical protein